MQAFILFFGLLGSIGSHPFHMSKCQVNYAETEKSLQISLHLFIDDLEACLVDAGAEQTFLCTSKEHEKAETWLFRYLEDHLQFLIDDQVMSYQWIGKEMDDDLMGMWCYLEIPNVSSMGSLEIRNTLLLERFSDQQHVTHITGPNNKNGYFLLHQSKTSDRIDF